MRSPNHVPFSQHIIESFPSYIWFSIMSVKDIVRKLCSCKCQMQVCKSSASIIFSLEAWTYLCRFLQPIRFSRCNTKPHQYSDLSLQSSSSIRFFFYDDQNNEYPFDGCCTRAFWKNFLVSVHATFLRAKDWVENCQRMAILLILWRFWREMMSQI